MSAVQQAPAIQAVHIAGKGKEKLCEEGAIPRPLHSSEGGSKPILTCTLVSKVVKPMQPVFWVVWVNLVIHGSKQL